MALRSVWKGSLACSVLNVPVKLYGATEEKSTVKFNQLSRDYGTRVQYKKVALDDKGKEVEVAGDEIVKGYEIAKDEYVIITDADLEAVKLPTISSIEIVQFIDEEIDPRMPNKSLFIGPDKGGEKAFSLLLQTMFSTHKKAIAKVTMREKEHIVMIQPFQNVLLLQQLFWPDELRPCDEIAPVKASLSEKELSLAINLVDSMTSPWNPSEYFDEYAPALRNLIQDKVAGKIIAPPLKSPIVPQADLLAQLTASLEKVHV